MYCSKCGNRNDENINFCRRCGNVLENLSLSPVRQKFPFGQKDSENLTQVRLKDPDELTGKGIENVIIGDGFFMVAVILSATHGAVSSLLWLSLLIPAFIFFGRGFADILHARQIRRRDKQANQLENAPNINELQSPRESFIDTFKKSVSGELFPVPSVTEKTTRDLK